MLPHLESYLFIGLIIYPGFTPIKCRTCCTTKPQPGDSSVAEAMHEQSSVQLPIGRTSSIIRFSEGMARQGRYSGERGRGGDPGLCCGRGSVIMTLNMDKRVENMYTEKICIEDMYSV